jgi:hypothetical protein
MSDISFHFTLIDLLVAAPVFGWPGLLLGGAAGALVWRKRRMVGALLGAILGCAVWFAIFIFTR